MRGREYWVYDGTTCIGYFVVDENGTAEAFDAAGMTLGNFADYDAARKAVSQAHVDAIARKASAAAALARLAGPVEFASGLPATFGGERRR